MSQNDDLYARMKETETKLEELNQAILKFKKDLEEEIFNIDTIIENIRENN